jgi:hypothetical protein
MTYRLEVVSKPHLRSDSPPASSALGHEPFGSELRDELLGPNGAARDGGQVALQTSSNCLLFSQLSTGRSQSFIPNNNLSITLIIRSQFLL